VVVGWFVTDIVDRFGNQVHAFRWTPATGIKDLGTLRDGTESIAEGISANGSVVVGQARDKDMFWHAFRWTATTGMQDLRTLGGTMSAASATSADGSVIVGRSLITSALGSERAFRWTTKNQMQDLRRELLNAGVTAVQNWVLITATSVSADGTVIVGYGRNPNKQWEAFRAVLPVPR
jgi:probable HAF family extracellular repeat protein